MRTPLVAGLTAVALIGSIVTAVPASATTPTITRFAIAKGTIAGRGGSVALVAATKHATTCRIWASIPIKGLPKTVSCADGSVHGHVVVPRSATVHTVRDITFTFAARRSSHVTRAHVTRRQDTTLAAIPSFSPEPRLVAPDRTTKVLIEGRPRHSTSCTLRSRPALAGLPLTTECRNRTIATTVRIRPNPKTEARTFTLTLTVDNGAHKPFTRVATITQLAKPTKPPTISRLYPSSDQFRSGAANYYIAAILHTANTCTLSSTPSLDISDSPVDCWGGNGTGTFTRDFSVPANDTGSARSYTFTFSATNSAGTFTRTLTVTQPPAP
jgi:Putative binding domain, N-terminal